MVISCSEKIKLKPGVSFYYWKSTFELSDLERQYLIDTETTKIYIKYFDIDLELSGNGYEIVAPVNFIDSIPKNISVIPTVFITNRTLSDISEYNVKDLSDLIRTEISNISSTNGISFNEIQIDCDWTGSTRKKYFYLLEKMRYDLDLKNIAVSVTLRLHQYRYPDITGVPPVERCVLMFYNIGEINEPETDNSIYDRDVALKYVNKNSEYPLDVIIALPIISWGVIFRYDEIVGLINDVTHQDMSDENFYIRNDAERVTVLKNHYFKGRYLYKGDVIRIEDVKKEKIIDLVKYISECKNINHSEIVLFSLTKKNILRYSDESISEIISLF